jgi:hypothetical protein
MFHEFTSLHADNIDERDRDRFAGWLNAPEYSTMRSAHRRSKDYVIVLCKNVFNSDPGIRESRAEVCQPLLLTVEEERLGSWREMPAVIWSEV